MLWVWSEMVVLRKLLLLLLLSHRFEITMDLCSVKRQPEIAIVVEMYLKR